MTSMKVIPKVGEYRQDIVEQDGLRWVIGRGTNDGLAVNHEMEPEGASIHDFICGHFGEGVTFLDIGAHVGHYTLRAAKAGCEVYAVEANPETAAQLRMNLKINKLKATIWAVAAWDELKPLDFSEVEFAPIRNGSASLADPERHPEKLGVTVMGIPLDWLLDRLPKLDVVKMDVEGADVHVIDGMFASLVRLRPVLIFEDHSFYGTYTEKEMRDREAELAAEAGYTWKWATDLGVRSSEKFRVGCPG